MSNRLGAPEAVSELQGPTAANILVLTFAAIASAGSVYLSVGLGLKACPLCFYQRTFAFAAFGTTLTLLIMDGARSPRIGPLALSLALGGLGVAGFHVGLVQTGKLECPPALFGLGDGPVQSLAIFAMLVASSLFATAPMIRKRSLHTLGILGVAGFLGAAGIWASIASAPPLPPKPAHPYDPAKQPFDTCRPPFTAT